MSNKYIHGVAKHAVLETHGKQDFKLLGQLGPHLLRPHSANSLLVASGGGG
jgi:hypothetical protein